jgi:prevent-host-death family protein
MVRIVGITALRQDGTRVIREAQQASEPTVIVVRSQPAVYLVGAQQYEAMVAELQQLRREALERDVAQALAEIDRGETHEYASARELMASL